MNAKQTRILLIIASLALAGLLMVQVYWFYQAFNIQQRQLTQQTNLAIRAIGNRLLLMEGDSTSIIPPVEVKEGGEYFLGLQTHFDYEILPEVIKEEFAHHQIYGNYFTAVESCNPIELVLGYTWNQELNLIQEPCRGRDQAEDCYNLSITFENQSQQLLGSMGIWIFSSIVFFLVLAYFAYSLFIMLREKRLATMRRDFINNMTHELKTPISNVGLAIEQLRKRGEQMPSAKKQHYSDIIFQENKRLEQQVERVLQMAMIEHSKIELKLENIDLHTLILDIKKNLDLKLEHLGGKLFIELKANHPIVKVDKFHLTNVILNLLDNAQKYSKEAPDIHLITEDEGDSVCVRVVDRGIGISKADQIHIFEKFYRVPSGNKHKIKGIGLGLSYVKMIIEAHGGAVGVQSHLHQGSQFWFTI